MVEFSNALFSKRVAYSDFISKKGQQKVTKSSHRRCSVKKSVLENFTNGKFFVQCIKIKDALFALIFETKKY